MTDAPKPTLTEAERESLFKAGDHHPDQCDCTAFADEVGYAPGHGEVCGGLEDTYDVVARIKAAARREALLEAANDMETAEFEDMRHVGCSPEAWKGWSDGSLASLMEGPMLWAPWLRDRAAALAEPERDEEGR